MAYTYDDFIKAAGSAGVLERFSSDDLTAAQKNPEYGLSMVGLLGDISKANTEEQRLLATEAVNQLRKNYGVTGTGTTVGTSVADASADGQKTIYQKQLESIVNPSSFSYDPESDASFQAYRKQYLREGERASADALAQASAASGGVPSSFAVTAAQQAGNYYAGQLADMIPTLEQNAYQRYLDQQAQAQERFDYALQLHQMLGYSTEEIANILGLPMPSKKTGNGGAGYQSSDPGELELLREYIEYLQSQIRVSQPSVPVGPSGGLPNSGTTVNLYK